MAILRKAVKIEQEFKRQNIIRQLLDKGITEHEGKSIYDLDYYTLRYILATERAKQ